MDGPAIPEIVRYPFAEQTRALTGVGGRGEDGVGGHWTLCHSQTEGKIDKERGRAKKRK